MAQRVIVIGAGIIGAAIAFRLSDAGMDVTVLEANAAASAASGRSFGWINASFFADQNHFSLRAEGIAAWHRACAALPGLPIRWQGSLWWEEQGAAFDKMAAELRDLGYPLAEITRAEIVDREPQLANPPERALLLPGEGAAETAMLTCALLQAAAARGAKVYCGIRALAVYAAMDRVTGAQTGQGLLPADRVVVAAGTEAPALLTPFGVAVPMLPRPGVLMVTRPLPPCLSHVMVAPGQEFRQLPDGRILAPTSASHQADNAEEIQDYPGLLADQTLNRLRHWLPRADLAVEQVSVAWRPVPGDGLPVVGPTGPRGLYVAVMHSGVTLAATIGELVARELVQGETSALLLPYRPARFG